MPFWSSMRKIDLNIVHWNIDDYTIEGMLMIYLFYLIQQNILTLLGLGFLGFLRSGGGGRWQIPPPLPPHFLKNGIRYKAEIW